MKDITEIIEIVFEGVSLEKTIDLLIRMLNKSLLRDYSISSDSPDINIESKADLLSSINMTSSGSFYFNFLDLVLMDISLSKLGLQIYKYNNVYDLNLNIEEKEVRRKISISDLQKSVNSLAIELEALDYYCGYEPAADKNTRFFSGRILGPLINWG